MKRSASTLIKSEIRECGIEVILITESKLAIIYLSYLSDIDLSYKKDSSSNSENKYLYLLQLSTFLELTAEICVAEISNLLG